MDTKDFEYFNEGVSMEGQCVAVLTNEVTGKKRVYEGKNIITTKGNRWYAARGAIEASAFAVVVMRVGLNSTAASAGDADVLTSIQGSGYASITAGYPKSSDADTDNTGRGSNIVTWAVTFAAASMSMTGIREVALTDSYASPANNINRALFAAAFDKTTSDTLKIFINHTFQGV